MAQPQNNVSLTAPGFAGLNTQDSPLDMDISFASIANNCTIDQFGRISSRRGFVQYTANPEILGGAPIQALDEFIDDSGTSWLFACGNEAIYLQNQGTPDFNLVALTLPNVPTANNWKMVPFNNKMYFVQEGHVPLLFDPAVPTELREWVEFPNGTDYPNEAHAAFGRLWCGDFTTGTKVVFWSGLLNGENWSSLGTGSLNTEEYWPSGYDEVVSLAAHNNFMCVFGKRNILLYQTTPDVNNTITLVDAVEGIGCISRDSMVATGTDYMFIDSTGVRSLNRTIQEKSVPIGDISRNVRVDFQQALAVERKDDVKAVYHVEDSFYVTFLPSNPLSYVFDTWSPLPDGSARATLWQAIPVRCGTRTLERETYFAGDYGVYLYQGAQDIYKTDSVEVDPTIETILMEYWTHPIDFGAPSNLIFPKQVDVTVFGGNLGLLNLKWAYDYKNSDELQSKTKPIQFSSAASLWNTDVEWGGDPGKTGFWTGQFPTLNQLKYNIWGSGRNVRIGFSTQILGSQVSIQEVNIQVLQGRIL